MSRIFLSHSSRDLREAIALKQWLAEQDPPLANDIFLDADPGSGLQIGTRWKEALRRANARCEAVVCLLSANWEASHECKVEYRTAENLNKQILCARLEPSTGDELTAEWQRCDLFGDGPKTKIDIGSGPPVEFATEGLYRLRDGIRGAGIGADSFVWPPPKDPQRAPYRGWEPLDAVDAAVFFGRDAQIIRALDQIRGMRLNGLNGLFVILGPSGTGKSSFLRAGLLPRLRREDRRFTVVDIVRPERNTLTGGSGLAPAIFSTRQRYGLGQPSLGDIKVACEREDVAVIANWLEEIRHAAAERLVGANGSGDAAAAPTLVVPLDQAEELFSADAGEQAGKFLRLTAALAERMNAAETGLVMAATIRTDRYEVMQTHPDLAGVGTVLFDELKPMPPTQFKEVIVGPAHRASEAGRPLRVAPDLVDRLLLDSAEGADTLPILALTMSRLYTDYGSMGELTLAHYQALGGMRRVVQTEIDEILSTDTEQRTAQLCALRSAFIPWLATINPENDQPMRRVAKYTDLPESSRPLLDALVAKRLMVKDIRDGQTVTEVALESLLRQWNELSGWLREERKDLKDADDLERAAAAWAANDRDQAWLLEGTRLAEATRLADDPAFRQRLSPTRAYLDASNERENQRREAEEQQRQAELQAAEERAEHARERQVTAEAHAATLRKRSRVLHGVLAGTALVAVIAVVASIMATIARGQAQDRFRLAVGLKLVSQGQAMLAGSQAGGDVRALQELLAGNRLHGDPDDNALFTAEIERDTTAKIIQTDAVVQTTLFSPHGNRVASVGVHGQVRVWARATGGQIGAAPKGHANGVVAAAFSRDGRQLTTGSGDAVLRWSIDTNECTSTPLQETADKVGSAALSPDGGRLAIGGWDGSIRVFDTKTGARVGPPLLGHQDVVYGVAFSADGRRLVSGGKDSTVRLWDIDAGKELNAPLAGHVGPVLTVTFSPDGSRVASGGFDSTVRQWDTATGQQIGVAMRDHNDVVYSVAYRPDGRVLASAGGDNAVRLWDTATNKPIGGPLSGHQFEVFSVAFSPDGRQLVSGSYDQTVRIWDVSSIIVTGQGELWGVAFSPDGHRLVTGGGNRTLQLWNADTGQPEGQPYVGHQLGVGPVAYSPDGHRVASGSDDMTVRLWDVDTGREIGAPLTGHTGVLWSLTFSPDGTRLVSGSADGTIRIWDAQSGKQIGQPLGGDIGEVRSVVFSPDGSRIASGSTDRTIRFWDIKSGKQIGEPFTGHTSWINGLAFSPDGARIVSAGNDGEVRLWDVKTGSQVGQPLKGHTDSVRAVAFSPDGRMVASGGADGDVRLWNVQTGQPIGEPLVGHHEWVTTVAFSPDGTRVVSAGSDGMVRLWPATVNAEVLCAKLTANMSKKQWNDWVSPDIDYIKTCPNLPVPSD
jgi:WD40 repeat protein